MDIVIPAQFVRIFRYGSVAVLGAAAKAIDIVPKAIQVGFKFGNIRDIPALDIHAYGPRIKALGPIRHGRFCLVVVPRTVLGKIRLKGIYRRDNGSLAAVAQEQKGYRHQGRAGIVLIACRIHEHFQAFGIFYGGGKTEGRHDFVLCLLLGSKHAVTVVDQVNSPVIFQFRKQVDIRLCP